MLLQVFTHMYISLHIHMLTCVNIQISIGHVDDQNKCYFNVQLYYPSFFCLYLYDINNKLSIQYSCIYTVILIMIMLKCV